MQLGATMLEARRPLIVRLRNWVGDVVLSTPVLLRLQEQGHELTLVGKGWAPDLLAGFGWPVLRLGATHGERVAQLAQWRRDVAQERWGSPKGINAISFPYSASSALEMRMAGLKAIGYDGEGRALLLHRSWPRPRLGRSGHELQVYWRLGQQLLGTDEAPPAALQWRVSALHQGRAQALMQQHGLAPGFVMLCPFAGGTLRGKTSVGPTSRPTRRRRSSARRGPWSYAPAQAKSKRPRGSTLARSSCRGRLGHLRRPDAAGLVDGQQRHGPRPSGRGGGRALGVGLGAHRARALGAWGPTVRVVRHWPRWPTVDEVWAASQAPWAR